MSDQQVRIDTAINSDELSAFEQFCNKAIHPGLYPGEIIMLANRSLMVAAAYREKCAEADDLREALNMYQNGYQGACMACEPVGEENVRLRKVLEWYADRKNYASLHRNASHVAYDGGRNAREAIGETGGTEWVTEKNE